MLIVRRSAEPPFAEDGPLAEIELVTGNELDLGKWASALGAALGLVSPEEYASLVVGVLPNGRWCGIRKLGTAYEWAVLPQGSSAGDSRTPRVGSSRVVINDPPYPKRVQRTIARIAQRRPLDRQMLARQEQAAYQLTFEIVTSRP